MPELSIVYVDYYHEQDLRRSMASIRACITGLCVEVLIVSNATYSEKEKTAFRARFADAVVLFNGYNAGFASAVNRGIRAATGEFVMILNPDTAILNDRCRDLLEFMRAHPDIAIAGPRLLGEHGEIQDSARRFMTPADLVNRTLQRLLNRDAGPVPEYQSLDESRPVEWVSRACMLVRRESAHRIGPLNEAYFMYVEDMDWCKRCWDQGMRVVYWPALVVQHRASRASIRALSSTRQLRLTWIHFKNYWDFWRRNARDVREWRRRRRRPAETIL